MKKLSRLTAVLLALLMLASVALADETMTIDQLNNNNYVNMLTDVQTYGLKAEAYDHFVREMEGMTVEQRYAKLVDWYGSYLGGIGFYKGFVNYYKTNYPDGNLICTCDAPFAYGATNHGADCKWHFGCLNAEEQQSALAGKLGEETLAAWLADETVTVTDQMLLWAMQTGSLESVVFADTGLHSVYTGEQLAILDAETNQLIDVHYHIAVAQVDPETGLVTALN